jgi:signal transduction histidine kinase/ActR/RegA family two-component response regulator
MRVIDAGMASKNPSWSAEFEPCAGHGSDHTVQFYEHEDFLSETVTTFLAEGLRAGQPALVVATPAHRQAFTAGLSGQGFDIDQLSRKGELSFLDAREALSSFMTGSVPDGELFAIHVGSAIDRIQQGRGHAVRVYGEMVDLLWRDDNPDAAIRLEGLWNDLAATRSFSLLCAYSMGNFHKETHAQPFEAVCRAHTRVVPAESYTEAADEDSRARAISVLQQRARALEAEIEHRKGLEHALRESLTARRRVEAERERLLAAEQAARVEAEKASRLKDEFLTVLSHELRTPLTAILGWAHIVTDSRTAAGTVRQGLDVIQRNARLQLRLVDDLLDISRIVTGKMQVSTERVDLAAILGAAVESVRPSAAARSIELSLRVDEAGRLVTGDPGRLQQVMWNLLSNAIKFTPEHGRIDVHVKQAGSRAQIAVRDTGQGIAAEFLPHVFERFRQADSSTTRKHGGLGLGLAVVRYLVEAHGGTISAASPGEGHGATFTIELPLWAAQPGRREDVPAEAGVSPLNARVLLVDDGSDSRELLKYVLEQSGAAVDVAASASGALHLLFSKRFDLMVADIGRPEADGYALMAAVRSFADPAVRNLPAVAMTACAGEHHRSRAVAAGFDEHLTKPVEPGRLSQIITTLARRRAVAEA